MVDEADTPQTPVEAQQEAAPKEAPPQPQAKETPPEPSADDFSPQSGETIEAYAARIKNEVAWRDRQIGRQHRKLKESEAQAAKIQEIEAENQRLRTPPAQTEAPKPVPVPPRPVSAPTGVPPDALAAARIQIEMERTEAALNKNPEWPSALANFQKFGGIPQDLMNAVLDTEDPAYVLVTLGKDMNRFTQIVDLPEGKRRAALVRIGLEPELKAATPKPEPKVKPSGAPSPTTALPSGGAVAIPEGDLDLYDPKYNDSDHDDAWYRKRAQEKANSKGRPWSVGGRSGPR